MCLCATSVSTLNTLFIECKMTKYVARSKSVRVNYAVAFIKRFTSMHSHSHRSWNHKWRKYYLAQHFLVSNSICVNALALVVGAAVFFSIAGAFIYSLFTSLCIFCVYNMCTNIKFVFTKLFSWFETDKITVNEWDAGTWISHLHVCAQWFSMRIVVFINLAIFNSNNVFNLDKRVAVAQLVDDCCGCCHRCSINHSFSLRTHFISVYFHPFNVKCAFFLLCVTECNINVPNFYIQGGQWHWSHFSHFMCAPNDRSDAIGHRWRHIMVTK